MFFSREDIEVWKEATRNVRRFLHMQDSEDGETYVNLPKVEVAEITVKKTKSKSSAPAYVADLIEGEAGRMDKNAYNRLKNGKMCPDAIEDLHGMSVFDARLHFHEFIQNAHANGKRTILLITGKGFASPSKIRSSLANWINDPALKPLILAYCRAQPKDGGDGAFYIYLGKF
jgi:DNA-nicking Smr family endonuclease